MNLSLKLLLTASAISMLAACGNSTSNSGTDASNKSSDLTATASAAATAQTLAVNAYRPAPATVAAQEPPVKARDLDAAPTATTVALGAPPASQTTAAQKSTAEDHMGKPMQIGFGRDVAQTASVSATNQILKWQATKSGGQVAAINFSSAGAKGLRVGLLITQLPETAILRFYAKGDTTAFEVKGSVVLAVIAKNLAAGDISNDARTYWSPVLKANNGTVEIEIPAGVDTSLVQTSVPIVSHLFMSMSEAQSTYDVTNIYRTGNTSTLACQVDVKCTNPLPAASDAVAWLVFNQTVGGAYICSGTLLNDNLNSGTPYILTANHCISTQTFASTLYTEFKYRSLICNNAATGEYFPTATTGSALLYTAYSTDSTLLQLYGTPSTTVLFAGWDATTAPTTSTTGIHSIHHPRGDQQRLSRGSITGYSTRVTDTSVPKYSEKFPSSNITSGTILDVTLNIGLTEGGSSGSGLFKGTDANPILIGQLFGGYTPGNVNPNNPNDPNNGTPACTTADPKIAMPSNNVYGRFDVAFNAGMKDFLVQGIKSVILFNNVNNSGVYFYTYNTPYINALTSSPAYINRGAAFKVSSYQAAGLSPVYRFYNTSNGTYFYTISEKERAAVASNTPRMIYEGIVWYASATAAAGTVPLYSAFNATNGSQYFTTDITQKAGPNAQFKADGIAFYVTP
jgi:lysyl endopeptidase